MKKHNVDIEDRLFILVKSLLGGIIEYDSRLRWLDRGNHSCKVLLDFRFVIVSGSLRPANRHADIAFRQRRLLVNTTIIFETDFLLQVDNPFVQTIRVCIITVVLVAFGMSVKIVDDDRIDALNILSKRVSCSKDFSGIIPRGFHNVFNIVKGLKFDIFNAVNAHCVCRINAGRD